MALHISAVVGEDHKLVIELPDDVPPGQTVEVIVQPVGGRTDAYTSTILTPEQARARMAVKGLGVRFGFAVPDDFEPLSSEALLEVGTLPEGVRSSLDLLDEERGAW